MDQLWQQINEAIHKRNTELVRQLIPKYIKSHNGSQDALYEASEFFRKITDYASALRVLPKEYVRIGVTEAQTKLELQQARLLNILGASDYALRVIERIRTENRAKSKIEMVEIYQCNYRFAEVVDLLGSEYPMPTEEPWHQDWLLHFYLANALNGLGHYDLAIKRVEKIRAISKSPLIRALTLCYQGKYLLAGGNALEALPFLLESQHFFQEQDKTADHAILQIHLGHCLLELEKYPEAESLLSKALKVFYQPAIKPEDWMEIVLLLERIPGYRKSSLCLAPRLFALVGSQYPPLKKAGNAFLGKVSDIFSVNKIEKERKTKHLDRGSDIAWNGQVARLGLDRVDELIWNLLYAGKYGLPQFRLYELLWPNELFSFDQHQKRLEQLIGRARAQGYEIAWKELHVRLLSKDVSASGRPQEVIRGYSFLTEHSLFKRREVEKYFSISSTSAKILCRNWLKDGFIKSINRSQYQALIR